MLVVIEGIDGSGKSTLSRMLRRQIEIDYRDLDSTVTAEPWHSTLSAIIRNEFKVPGDVGLTPGYMAILFSADRVVHVREFQDKIEDPDHVVICDRYKLSMMAYQMAKGIDPKLCMSLYREFPEPDYTILLDIDPNSARLDDGEDAYEADKEFQAKVRTNYKNYFVDLVGNGFIFDARPPADEVLEAVMERLRKDVLC